MTGLIGEWIAALGAWSWAVLGVLLLLAEVLLPGVFLFWFGLAAIAVAIQSAVIPLPWEIQLVFFILYSGVFIWLARWFDRRRIAGEDTQVLNQRGAALIGRVVELDTAIENGFGQAKVDDTVWRVRGPDHPTGASVKIAGADGAVLVVEALGEDETSEASS